MRKFGRSFSRVLAECGRQGFNLHPWDVSMAREEMDLCVRNVVGVKMSETCVKCFIEAFEHSWVHCNQMCHNTGWCSQGCSDCTAKHHNTKECVGVGVDV